MCAMTGLNIQFLALFGYVVGQVFIRLLRYYGTNSAGRIVKILCKTKVLGGTATLPPLSNSLPKGAIGQYIENHPSPQPSPIVEGVSNNLNHEDQSGVPHDIDCHPKLVSGSHKMLKQVQDDMFSFPKRTYSLYKQAAFTLAEVLITLGIIGVVAAMTMPSLISNYRHKVLESQFKKAYSVISQLGAMVISEYGDCSYSQTEDIKEFMLSNLVKGEQTTDSDKYTNFFTYTKNKASVGIHFNCLDNVSWTNSKSASIPEGMQFALCSHNSGIGTIVAVDTNGAGKRSNAFGHDIFFFHFNTGNCRLEPITYTMRNCTDEEKDSCTQSSDTYNGWKSVNGECSHTSTSSTNGFACAQYAVTNTCPDSSGKVYFDCLP